MTQNEMVTESLSPDFFQLWTPPPGRSVAVGAERRELPLPQVPLPLHGKDAAAGEPDDNAIGAGIYDYLREFPDCPHNRDYARLLQEAYPHYVADIGSQIVMLDARPVDPPYIRRKITLLKILLLIEPHNRGLLQQLGMAHYQVGLMFSELHRCRLDLLKALGYLQRAQGIARDLLSLNYLGQIDYFFGDYPAAARHWQGVVDHLPAGPARDELQRRLARIDRGDVPDHPLIDDLEKIGQADADFRAGALSDALAAMEELVGNDRFLALYRPPEFFYFLGLCREKTGDGDGAAVAFAEALRIEGSYAPAQEGLQRVTAREDG